MSERKDAQNLSNPTGQTAQTPAQRRAADALRAVLELDPDETFRKRYRAYVDRLGPSILMNGLGQALASERAAAGNEPSKREEKAHESLYRNIQAWLHRSGVYNQQVEKDLLQAIVKHGEKEYLRAQAETLAWLVWHKKFCRAYLPPSDDE